MLIYGALFAVVGLKTYLPYMAALLVFHAGVVHAVWRLMRRCGSHPWIATGAAGVLLVFGYGAANILWPFQISFVGALLVGLVQILLLDRDGPFGRRDALAVGVGTAGLLFSGIAVPMVV
ncbi:MAG TPA: hypothetical protein VG602_10625, partial [Actinomycetota bacterium]|nr:hypothetical protein [Actinomycetota bacterium]